MKPTHFLHGLVAILVLSSGAVAGLAGGVNLSKLQNWGMVVDGGTPRSASSTRPRNSGRIVEQACGRWLPVATEWAGKTGLLYVGPSEALRRLAGRIQHGGLRRRRFSNCHPGRGHRDCRRKTAGHTLWRLHLPRGLPRRPLPDPRSHPRAAGRRVARRRPGRPDGPSAPEVSLELLRRKRPQPRFRGAAPRQYRERTIPGWADAPASGSSATRFKIKCR